MNKEMKIRRTLQGKVVSNKMNQTVVVLVARKVIHPVYKKYVTRTTKIHAHDSDNTCQIGDLVTITESRPISKTKSWVVESILERALGD